MEDPLSFLGLTEPAPAPPLSLVSTVRVPNIFPTTSGVSYRLAIIGEAPGAEEEATGIPFVGASGHHLDKVLAATGILRSACFIGNVCKYRPPGNEITAFGFDHPKVLEGWQELQLELKIYDPHCILALGNTPLYFLCNRTGITNWRGSILQSTLGYKTVPALHPAAVLRDFKTHKLLNADTYRARQEAEFPDLRLPQRLLELDLSADEICYRLDNWPAGQLLSFDIEGGLDAFPCCSVADSSNRGFIIAWSRHTELEQGRIYVSLSRALYSTAIPKVLQNSLYDRFVLAYGYRMLIRNVTEDTMDKSWAIYPELKKSLALICSIWTKEPYYKFERKTSSERVYHEYCIKDSCVTLEASLAMDGALSAQERRHYEFNVSLKDPLLYMELRGFHYNSELANSELGQVRVALAETAQRIETRVQPMQFTKKEFSSNIRGAGGSISDKRLKTVLYEQKGYPPQYKGRGPDKRATCNVEALLNLGKKRPSDPFLADILLHRKLESISETLQWLPDPRDGRMKCAYNQFSKGEDNSDEGGGSTETGRLRCSKSIIPVGDEQVGGNLQTVTKKLRKLYMADEGYWLFQCDLAGADGWTVAAHCLRHGDPTMWDDYSSGLKPAKIVALMFEQGSEATRCSLSELQDRCLSVDQDGWLYFACKRIQHATNYGVTPPTIQKQVMIDSYKITGRPVYQEASTYARLQQLYLLRYPGVLRWQNWAKREVSEGRDLISASGHTRKFFGRRRSYNHRTREWEADHETWKEFLADEPQENTTYATNLALCKLWNDPNNRRQSKLIIEPLHQVHDALIGQFPKQDTETSVVRLRTYFANTLTIANVQVTIPFEGAYGPSWGELGPKHGGGTI